MPSPCRPSPRHAAASSCCGRAPPRGSCRRTRACFLFEQARRRRARTGPAPRGRHLLRQVRDLPRRRGPADRRDGLHRRPPPRLGGEPGRAGSTTTRRLVDAESGLMDTLPVFRRTIDARRPRGPRSSRSSAARPPSPGTGARPWRCSSSTAATARSRPTPTTSRWVPWVRAGRSAAHPRRLPRPGRRRAAAVRDLPARARGRLRGGQRVRARCGRCAGVR